MASRAIAWVKEDGGAEFADVLIASGLGPADRLTASGMAIGSKPMGYRLDYKLETKSEFITSGLLVVARGEGWRRRLDLRRLRSGTWSARTKAEGDVDLPAPGGDMTEFDDALDCDLALSPLTNSMPVLRHGLLEGGGPVDFFDGVGLSSRSVGASRPPALHVPAQVRRDFGGPLRIRVMRLRRRGHLRRGRPRNRLPGDRAPGAVTGPNEQAEVLAPVRGRRSGCG